MIDILHLHGFKCAGTTFASILQNNYGDAVGYVESEGKGDRLPWQLVPGALDLDHYKAVSSHLVTLPPADESFAKMNVAFVRTPRERIKSAYLFQLRTGALKPKDLGFAEFMQRMEKSTGSNYQTRHLSPQDFGGWQQRKGWQLRPELIDFNRDDLFIGLVERFDESLVVLETRLKAMGIDFDASYPSALNVAPKNEDQIVGIPINVVEIDDVLHARAHVSLTASVSAISDFSIQLSRFKERCAGRAKRGGNANVPEPSNWCFVDTSTFPELLPRKYGYEPSHNRCEEVQGTLLVSETKEFKFETSASREGD